MESEAFPLGRPPLQAQNVYAQLLEQKRRKGIVKTAMFYGGKDIRVEEVRDPIPGPGQALIRIKAAGICGSNLHGYRSGPRPGRTGPGNPGHELAGVVAALGSGVTKVKVGDRVGIEPRHLIGCGECRWCRRGHNEACPTRGQVDGIRRGSPLGIPSGVVR